MLKILQAAMPGGLTQGEWFAKAHEAGVTVKQRRSEAKLDLKAKKLIHEYADRWFVTSVTT